MKARNLIAAFLALTALGCQTYGSNFDKPARIVNPDDASRAALQDVVNTAFGGLFRQRRIQLAGQTRTAAGLDRRNNPPIAI